MGFVLCAASRVLANLPERTVTTRVYRGAPIQQVTQTIVSAAPLLSGAASGAVSGVALLPRVLTSSASASATPGLPIAPPLTLSACSETLYTLVVQFPGATPTSYNLQFDTGSADVIVLSTNCDNTCNGDPNKFPVSAPGNLNVTGMISYGTGSASASGELYGEKVSVGAGVPSTAQDMAILAVRTTKGGLFQEGTCLFDLPPAYYFDGLIGFSQAYGEFNSFSVVGFLYQAGVPAAFSALLCDLGGYLWIGGYDPKACAQTPSFTPLQFSGLYTFSVSSIKLGGKDAGFDLSLPWIADSGTNYLTIPGATAAIKTLDQQVADLLGVENFFVGINDASSGHCVATDVPRSHIDAALPALEYTLPAVGSGEFLLSFPATYSYIQVQFASDGTQLLCPNLFDGNLSPTFNVMPNNLMNNLLVVFDLANNQLGFAAPAPSLCSARAEQQLQYRPQQPAPPPSASDPAQSPPAGPLPKVTRVPVAPVPHPTPHPKPHAAPHSVHSPTYLKEHPLRPPPPRKRSPPFVHSPTYLKEHPLRPPPPRKRSPPFVHSPTYLKLHPLRPPPPRRRSPPFVHSPTYLKEHPQATPHATPHAKVRRFSLPTRADPRW